MVDGGNGAEGLSAEEDEGAAERLPCVSDDGVGLEGVERGGCRRADEGAQAAPRRVHTVEASPAVAARVRDVAERAVVEGALALDVDPRLAEQARELEVVRLRQRGVRRRPPHPAADSQLHGAFPRLLLPALVLTKLAPGSAASELRPDLARAPASERARDLGADATDEGRRGPTRAAGASELDTAARISMRRRQQGWGRLGGGKRKKKRSAG